ncbi:MAG: SIS domain-containing protein [Candidatus Rokubacteria bacterium]|nr:SIS domain-containing protein [Candidatus Rokubacteria bacterium]
MSLQSLVGLAGLLTRIEATDASGAPLALDEGLARAVDIVRTQTAAGRKVIFIGNGGSAAIASHQAVDYWKNGGMRAVAFNDPSLLTCVSNDFGYPHVFEKPIEMFADAGDVLVAISSSGKSENILRGAEAAGRTPCRIITLSGFQADNPLRRLGELNFWSPSSSYGHVEITHHAICHAVVDAITAGRG